MPKRRLPTLDVFIQQGIARDRWPSNSWVTCYGFAEMYVRLTKRYIDNASYYPCLDLANMTARWPGNGAFSRLVARLRTEYPKLHLLVEQAHERFGAHLVKLGFTKLVHGESYFLKAGQ